MDAEGSRAEGFGEESLMDLISGFGKEKEAKKIDEAPAGGVKEEKRRSGKGKGGEK